MDIMQRKHIPRAEGTQTVSLHGRLGLVDDGRADVVQLHPEALEVGDEGGWVEGRSLWVYRCACHLKSEKKAKSVKAVELFEVG